MSEMKVIEKGYAKINLILNVLNKLDDGYHNIDFLMTTIDIFDQITVTIADYDQVEVIDYPELSNQNNLAFKAIKLIKDKYQINQSFKVSIIKNIPIGAGLAGGSVDGSATLRAINKLMNLNKTLDQLADISIELGSDLPFCIYSQLARVSGTGQTVKLLDHKYPSSYVLVINPGVELSTKDVYQNHHITIYNANINKMLNTKNHDDFYKLISNDLTDSAKKLEPLIDQIENDLINAGSTINKMSGSGATMLAFFKTKKEAEVVLDKLTNKYKYCLITKVKS